MKGHGFLGFHGLQFDAAEEEDVSMLLAVLEVLACPHDPLRIDWKLQELQ